jgi:hypothetical protein
MIASKSDLRPHGGALAEILPSELRPLLQFYEAALTQEHKERIGVVPGKLRFGFSAQSGYAAQTHRIRDKEYLIVISQGLLVRLHQIFSSAASGQSYVTTAAEVWSSKYKFSPGVRWIVKERTERLQRMFRPFVSFFGTTCPIEAVRCQLAVTLTFFALEFVLLHEIWHIQRVHLNLPEFLDESRDRQHLEVEADEYTCDELSDYRAGAIKSHAFSQVPMCIFDEGTLFSSGEDFLNLWLFSLCILYIAVDDWTGLEDDFTRRIHPHPYYRLIRSQNVIRASLIAQGITIPSAAETFESTMGVLESCKFGVGPIRQSCELFQRDGMRERLDERIDAGLRGDYELLSPLRLQFHEHRLPKRVLELLEYANQALENAPLDNLEALMKSGAYIRLLQSPQMRELVHMPEFEVWVSSPTFRQFFRPGTYVRLLNFCSVFLIAMHELRGDAKTADVVRSIFGEQKVFSEEHCDE